MRLVFVGGSKGVGKTSLCREVVEANRLQYVHTGTIVGRYKPFHEAPLIKTLLSEGDKLIDTHYAASYRVDPYLFYQGISDDGLRQISEGRIWGKVILITSSPKKILGRRISDAQERRCLDAEQIILENEENLRVAGIYSKLLKIPRFIINNNGSFEQTKNKLLEILNER
jgi:adenylate kinase